MNNLLAFDIETVPDTLSGRRLHQLEDLDDKDVLRIMRQYRLQSSGTEWLPPYLHRIVAISVVRRNHDRFLVRSIGDADTKEGDLVRIFFDWLERHAPTLITWNGGGFDLPVLHYRAMLHGVSAPRYWEIGDRDSSYRYNNYLNRYHYRHIDLMDVLAAFNRGSFAPLDGLARILGFPGKMGMDGSEVERAWSEDGGIERIRAYCECDALNTWLIYLRFELMRGNLSNEGYLSECEGVRQFLAEKSLEPQGGHFAEFQEAWKNHQDADPVLGSSSGEMHSMTGELSPSLSDPSPTEDRPESDAPSSAPAGGDR
ncbi:3'-5' exonuclease [Thioalkalivibrio sp. HK1]|uniref:3'-5' exonuclease n=1 Tax=Thioalkalivibrio sp. HK1 TaxID=1469245 RepID=UPI0004723494|nr:3'-5' exonuclease [Thioalkalivibrio sp. HK1]